MINSRHILNLSIELITKPQALGRTSCYKCNGTKREAGRTGVGIAEIWLDGKHFYLVHPRNDQVPGEQL